MIVLKCKMCGGDIALSSDKTFGTCECCGSSMTFPRVSSQKTVEMFNRGNYFRRIGEFDQALSIFEDLIKEDPSDAEAHWCCALCRFGIEYVEDPLSLEWLPTCHRASLDIFTQDIDYLAALEYSEGLTRKQYEKDAYKIDEVQRGILATSQNEEPFDIFICYKETEDDGERTQDSIIAQDIYDRLVEKGFRVFFSRTTLEEKPGTQYEPYIFAALNSAKVMIVVGTSKEHLESVWVKNEWSRFIALMKKDRSRVLIPCYRHMNPAEMPDILSKLQAYNIEKIGFMQDLVRGIEKFIKKPEPAGSNKAVEAAISKGIESFSIQQAQNKINRGHNAFRFEKYEEAYNYYSDGLVTLPDDFSALYRRGICAVRLSMDNPPIAEFKVSLEKTQKACDEYRNVLQSVATDMDEGPQKVILHGISSNGNKVQLIKSIIAATNLTIKEAKDYTEHPPYTVKEGLSHKDALALKAVLEASGGIVSLIGEEAGEVNTAQSSQLEKIKIRDQDLVCLISTYMQQTSKISTHLSTKEACDQQAWSWCCAANVLSVAAEHLINESQQEQYLSQIIDLIDSWLYAHIDYQVTTVTMQKTQETDLFGNKIILQIPVETQTYTSYTLPDRWATILTSVRTNCIKTYNSMPARVRREQELSNAASEKKQIMSTLKDEFNALNEEFKAKKEHFYELHPDFDKMRKSKRFTATITTLIGILAGILCVTAFHLSTLIGVALSVCVMILSWIIYASSVSNIETKIFPAELKTLQSTIEEKQKAVLNATSEYNAAKSSLKAFEATKK